jgi:hypothetical protein
MSKFWIYLVIVTLLIACKGNVKTDEEVHEKSDSVKAYIKIDTTTQAIDTILLAVNDTAFVVKNKLIADDIGDKQKEYTINIHFSNRKLPILTYKNAIGADLFLNGDLDGDGQPELLLRPEWFSSCWASINVFSLKNNSWKLIKKGSMYFCSDQYPLNKRVIKTEKGWGLLTDSLADDKFITLKKEIKF